MSDDHHSPEYYNTTFRKLITYVGLILVVGTAVTFAADLIGVFKSFTSAIIFALTVAVIKAAAVVAVFMHLYWDKNIKTISITLICTVIFFIGMMWLTLGSESTGSKPGRTDTTWKHVPEAKAKENK